MSEDKKVEFPLRIPMRELTKKLLEGLSEAAARNIRYAMTNRMRVRYRLLLGQMGEVLSPFLSAGMKPVDYSESDVPEETSRTICVRVAAALKNMPSDMLPVDDVEDDAEVGRMFRAFEELCADGNLFLCSFAIATYRDIAKGESDEAKAVLMHGWDCLTKERIANAQLSWEFMGNAGLGDNDENVH